MKKNLWQVIPAIGYVGALIVLLYTAVYALPTEAFSLVLVFILIELVVVIGIIRRNIWAYRINILMLVLSIYGLFTSSISFDSILSLMGELLVIPFYREFVQNNNK